MVSGTESKTAKPAESAFTLLQIIAPRPLVTERMRSHEYHGNGTLDDPFVIDWIPEDPKNPLEFPTWLKWVITFIMSLATLSVSLSSTVLSGITSDIEREFGISNTLAVGTGSFFVLGFAFGGMAWGPLSEVFGRQVVYASTYLLFTIFGGVSIASSNIQTLFVMRFLAGVLWIFLHLQCWRRYLGYLHRSEAWPCHHGIYLGSLPRARPRLDSIGISRASGGLEMG